MLLHLACPAFTPAALLLFYCCCFTTAPNLPLIQVNTLLHLACPAYTLKSEYSSSDACDSGVKLL
jgi:hypothetical protein